MLQGDFYTIIETQSLENNTFSLRLKLNSAHRIFEGHFPGNPIVPGVCLTQMVKEICESLIQKNLILKKADNIKFTAIVNPFIHPILETKLTLNKLDDDSLKVELSFFSGELVFYKFKGSYTEQA